MKSFLTANDLDYLRMKHDQMREKRYADRIKTILFLNMGDSFSEIAQRLMLDDDTIRNYYHEYEKDGIENLLKDEYTGKNCSLNKQQLQELDLHVQGRIYTDSKALAAHIKNTYGIIYTHDAVNKLLHRLDFVYKKPKHIPSKADPEEQEVFIKQYEQLKITKNPEDKIFFVDAVHPLHNSQPAYGWIKKGEEKGLKSNTGRQRVNLNGAYNIEDHRVTIREDESINSQSTIALFEKLLEEYPLGILYIIRDNARYYYSQLVKEFLEKHPRMQYIKMPPYSPNLNLIERLWGFFKEETTHNIYYEKFAEFKKKCLDFFENIDDYKVELERRMTENFQRMPVIVKNTT
jgi:transposase